MGRCGSRPLWAECSGFGLDTLSMGTTADFEAAILEGSTLVRIGTAIFGPRNKGAIITT